MKQTILQSATLIANNYDIIPTKNSTKIANYFTYDNYFWNRLHIFEGEPTSCSMNFHIERFQLHSTIDSMIDFYTYCIPFGLDFYTILVVTRWTCEDSRVESSDTSLSHCTSDCVTK